MVDSKSGLLDAPRQIKISSISKENNYTQLPTGIIIQDNQFQVARNLSIDIVGNHTAYPNTA